MKLLRVILIVSEVLFALMFVAPKFVESRPLAMAIIPYYADPSAHNRSELEHQQDEVRGRRFRQNAYIFAVLAANSIGLFYVSRSI